MGGRSRYMAKRELDWLDGRWLNMWLGLILKRQRVSRNRILNGSTGVQEIEVDMGKCRGPLRRSESEMKLFLGATSLQHLSSQES